MTSMDRDALLALYNATDGPHWTRNTNWNTDAAISDWFGVQVNHAGRVWLLWLSSNKLRGILRPRLPCERHVLIKSCSLAMSGLSQELRDPMWSFHEIASYGLQEAAKLYFW